MIDDCSVDNSKKIMEKYSNKYSNFISIFHEKNSGRAAIPRNNGLKKASGEYIMFLDPDDEYSLDVCETLYNTVKKYDVDIAFGRYVGRYDNRNMVEKSHSPFKDDIVNKYPKIKFDNKNDSKGRYLINNIVDYIAYGSQSSENYSSRGVDIVYADNIEKEPLLLRISPSIWTKIYKRELIFNNEISFPPFRLGEDAVFNLQTFLKAKGIVFLNNFIACYYSVRDSEGNRSVSKNINFKLLNEGIDNPICCSKCTIGFSNKIRIFAVNPHVIYWFNRWRQSNSTNDENKFFIKKLQKLKKIHCDDFRSRFSLVFIITYIKLINYINYNNFL